MRGLEIACHAKDTIWHSARILARRGRGGDGHGGKRHRTGPDLSKSSSHDGVSPRFSAIRSTNPCRAAGRQSLMRDASDASPARCATAGIRPGRREGGGGCRKAAAITTTFARLPSTIVGVVVSLSTVLWIRVSSCGAVAPDGHFQDLSCGPVSTLGGWGGFIAGRIAGTPRIATHH